MEAVLGICMVLDNEGLFKLKESMVDIDETNIETEIDEDGNEITVQYRSVLPFLSAFNKSVYDVIFREHHRLQNEIGASKYTKALLRFDDWFKQNGIVEAHANEIEPFWSSGFDETELSESETDPPPLSDGDKWEDVLLEIEMLQKGTFQLRVLHPSLEKQTGVVLPMDNWQTKLRNILMMQAWMPSYRFNRDTLVEKYGEGFVIDNINRQDVYRLNLKLKEAIGITNQKPIMRMEETKDAYGKRIGDNPVLPSIRLSEKLVYQLLKIDLEEAKDYLKNMDELEAPGTPIEEMDYVTQYYYCQPDSSRSLGDTLDEKYGKTYSGISQYQEKLLKQNWDNNKEVQKRIGIEVKLRGRTLTKAEREQVISKYVQQRRRPIHPNEID
jgi:hypothetical protein